MHRRAIAQLIGLAAVAPMAWPAWAFDLSALSQGDANSALRQALTSGGAAAIGKLGVENGFLLNDKVKIPLPPALAKAERVLKVMGLQKQADELVMAMNRAAEAAVPEAKALVTNAVKTMTVQDAKTI